MKKHPVSSWKRVGFCGYKKEPLVTFLVPSFFKWVEGCNLSNKKNGVEYCGASDVAPFMIGEFESGGTVRRLLIHLEAFYREKPRLVGKRSESWVSPWEREGTQKSLSNIILGGQEADRYEIEDTDGKVLSRITSQTLVQFGRPHVGGMIYFIEVAKVGDYGRATYLDDRVFQPVIEEVIKSFKYEIKTELEDSKDSPKKKST